MRSYGCRNRGWSIVVAAVLGLALLTPSALGLAAPPRLSNDAGRADIRSSYGSGAFGSWTTDRFGLPGYRYTIDELTAPQAAQPELGGRRDAWHQLGNDHIVADAFNTGYVELWNQDRDYEWINAYDAPHGHYSGGFGYLRLGGRTYSTLHTGAVPGERIQRTFGLGYFSRQTTLPGARVDESVYAPMGDDPVLLHDVTITNSSSHIERPSWFEYWDVNPTSPKGLGHPTLAPRYDAANRTVTVAQGPDATDRHPLSIFAAALRGPVDGFDADSAAFFGDGGPAAPAAVRAGRLPDALAPASPSSAAGRAMAAFRAPLTLEPGRSVTLRYAFGYGHADRIPQLVARWKAAPGPLETSERAWASYVPQADFGPRYAWLSRELQWDAYMVRSGATYEECAGHHIISQGGYYQYGLDFQGAFRDPLQFALPMIYADPSLAREVILYSAGEQPRANVQVPYGRQQNCTRLDLGTSDDLDLWLLWTAAEYGLASRQTSFFDQQIPWTDGGRGSLWQHLKQAFAHQESQRSADGLYLAGSTGDWSDLLVPFAHLTESSLVAAQAAYVYPRLAALADLRGDHGFAAKLRVTTAGLRKAMDRQWVSRGWYARGYAGARQLGSGTIYEEPQPWAILAGLPDGAQARKLVANVRRYLTGVGAPGGPSRIGSAQSPASSDPGATEKATTSAGVGDGHAAFPGGSWYALDGWLTWALGTLDREVPQARTYAFSEFTRNTLAAHAAAYPNSWDGVISVDDACRSWYSSDPSQCGVGLTSAYDTQIMHQPAWGLYDAIMLAGVTPTAAGYTIAPHLPMGRFSLRFPQVGVAQDKDGLSGYVRVARSGALRMRVVLPGRSSRAIRVVTFADGRRTASTLRGGTVSFTLAARAGRPADWAVVVRPAATQAAACPTTPDPRSLPSAATLERMNAFVARLGVRPTGSVAQMDYIAWIRRQLRGLRGVRLSELRFPINRWTASTTRLRIRAGAGAGWTTLPVADAIPYSKPTGSTGVTAPLSVIPDSEPITAGNARGRIVLREADAGSVSLAVFGLPIIAWDTYDPGATIKRSGSFLGDFIAYNDRVKDLRDAGAAGAKGILFVKNLPLSQIRGHYEPYEGIEWSLPGIFLGADQGQVISRAIGAGRPVTGRITVIARTRRVVTPSILATIRGVSPQRIVVDSHTDGTNAVEDNGPVAMVVMARYLDSLPARCLPRTVEFAFSTAHFYQRVASPSVRDGGAEQLAQRLDRDYPRGTVSVVLALEHLGARDYEQSPRGHGKPGYVLKPNGLRAIQFIGVTPSPPLLATVESVVRRYRMLRSVLLRGSDAPGNTVPAHCSFGGEGTPYEKHLLPTIGVISAPQYLYDPAFGLPAIDFGVMHSELLGYTDLVLRLGRMRQSDIAGQVTSERRERSAGAPACPSGA
jgi:hypothetical protein